MTKKTLFILKRTLYICLIGSILVLSLTLRAEQKITLDQQQVIAKQKIAHIIQQRAALQGYFNNAYQQYPSLPAGILESIAYTATRWQHRLSSIKINKHIHDTRPQPIGVFGLYNTDKYGFENTLAKVAKTQDITINELLTNTESYVIASAGYLAKQITNQQLSGNDLANYTKVIASLSGIRAHTQVAQYAQQSFIYDVLLSANNGIFQHGIEIKSQKINWQKAFTTKQLQQLKSPSMLLDNEHKTIRAITPEDSPIANIKNKKLPNHNSSSTSTNDIVDYPDAIWHPTPNQSSRKGSDITHIVLHTTQGSYAASINWLADPAAQASAHYVIRSSDGQVTQMVRDADKAWHARSANPYSIGIEHEGFVDNADWYTDVLYTSSANLTKYMCALHNIDCSKAYAGPSHSDVHLLSQNFTIKGHQHYPDQSHTDPGINWDWPRYFTLVTDGKVELPNQAPMPVFTLSCKNLSCNFDASASSDSDGTINSYTWKFGDNNSANGDKISHTYTSAGSYTVELTVIDNKNASQSLTKAVSVKEKIIAKNEQKSGGAIYGDFWLMLLFSLAIKRQLKNQIGLITHFQFNLFNKIFTSFR